MPNDKKSERQGPSVSPQEALDFHSSGRPGKLEITPTKPMATQREYHIFTYPLGGSPFLLSEEWNSEK